MLGGNSPGEMMRPKPGHREREWIHGLEKEMSVVTPKLLAWGTRWMERPVTNAGEVTNSLLNLLG